MLLNRFFPKQPNFFQSLSDIADLALNAADLFQGILKSPADLETNTSKISEIELKCDQLVRQNIETLAATFITPIERDHLHSLYRMSDEIVDLIYASSERFVIYKITEVTPKTQEMINLTRECVKQFQDMVHNLDEMESPEQLKSVIRDIHKTENEIDKKMRHGMAELYDSNLGVSRILKERDLILVIERISDSIEEAAQLIEAILIDQA